MVLPSEIFIAILSRYMSMFMMYFRNCYRWIIIESKAKMKHFVRKLRHSQKQNRFMGRSDFLHLSPF